MKIVSFLVTFNDPEYLEQTIESIKDYPDKLFIIEGSWKSAQESSGAKPRSEQETFDIIGKYVDNKRIFLIQANEHRERNQRQVGLEIAKQEKADWCHMFDSDEVYKKTSLAVIKSILRNTASNITGYRVSSYNFINSFRKWYVGNYARIYRVTPGAQFYMDNDVVWPEMKTAMAEIPGYSFYHYNYVKLNKDAFWRKMKYQNEQDPSFNVRVLPQYGYDEAKKLYKIPDDIKIYDFNGKHPKIMKNHPYFTSNVFNDTNLEFTEI